MHNIGENVLYGSNGVMTVVDIREEQVADVCRSYYVLSSVSGRSESLVFVPTDNERLTSFMHTLLTADEIKAVLDSPIDTSLIEWNDNSRARTEYFKRVMESGDRALMLAMIRAIHESGLKRLDIGKKNFLADENVKQRTEKLLASEFALVLGLDEGAALELVKEKVEC